jgi:hypothetical protein
MSIATLGQLLVLLGPSFIFQDTSLRISLPPEERLALIFRHKEELFHFMLNLLIIIDFFRKDQTIQNIHDVIYLIQFVY